MFMREIGYLDKEDADMYAIEFGEQLDHFEQELKDNVDNLAEELRQEKESLAEQKADLRSEGWSREELKNYLLEAGSGEARLRSELAAAKEKLAAFKTNRRGYLVAYVNNEVHGTPFPTEYTQ